MKVKEKSKRILGVEKYSMSVLNKLVTEINHGNTTSYINNEHKKRKK